MSAPYYTLGKYLLSSYFLTFTRAETILHGLCQTGRVAADSALTLYLQGPNPQHAHYREGSTFSTYYVVESLYLLSGRLGCADTRSETILHGLCQTGRVAADSALTLYLKGLKRQNPCRMRKLGGIWGLRGKYGSG